MENHFPEKSHTIRFCTELTEVVLGWSLKKQISKSTDIHGLSNEEPA